MTVQEYGKDEVSALLRNYILGEKPTEEDKAKYIGSLRDVIAKINVWLARGDKLAVYENHDFGSRDMGQRKFVSYGSPQTLLEVPEAPPILPDTGTQINWRYALIGTYDGDPLEMPNG